MKKLEKVLNDNLHILYHDPDIKNVFPEETVSVLYRRRKCFKELISLSLYPRTLRESASRASVMRADVTFVRVIRCLKMNSFVLLQVRHIR